MKAKLPPECEKRASSFIYFFYTQNNKKECLSLLLRNKEDVNIVLNPEDNLKGFKMYNSLANNDFYLENVCDKNVPYAKFNTSITLENKIKFEIRSKFSCGMLNVEADFYENKKIPICIFFMTFGLVLLFYGGIKFKQLMIIIIFVLTTVIILLTILSIFNFHLNNLAIAIITSVSFALSLLTKLLIKIYKYVTHIIIGYFGISLSFNISSTFYPDFYLHQRVN